jgi:myosin heavy subunit
MKTEFGIHHFAGPVIYDASEFIERNSDKLPDSLLHLASKSSNPLISKEFCGLVRAQETDDSTDTSRKAKQNTVMERFRSQLRTLLDEMSETHVRYIRCIKPSGEMKPSHVDNKTVMRQLTCAGLVTAIEITRETFPNKLTFKVAIERFRCLLDCGRQQLMIDMEPHEKCQFMMTALFAPEIEKFNSSHFTMPFACGKTKVFYRAGSLEILEMARHNFLSAKATRIQAFVRKLLSYEEFDRSRKAIICLQSFVRQVKAHAIFMREIRAIICLQAYTRRWSRRLRREARQIDLVSSESHFATTICSWYRARHSRKAYKQTLRCVVVLQACFRSKRVTDLIMIRRGAVFAIEAWYLKARSKGKLQTYQKTACPQPYNGIPTVVEFCESASPSDTLEELHDETRSVPLVEKVPVNVGQDLIEEQLMRELQNEKFKVDNLEKEIDQMRTDAELHAQEIEADFEERVNGYEDEVLVLKRTIAKMEDDSRKLTEETEAAEEAHKKNVQRLQFEIRKIQGSHRDYLDKIMALLDDTETAQKLQTSRIREEMEAIKRERDIQVNSLKDEIKLLRSIGFGTRKNKLDLSDKAQRLSRKLYAILSPDNVLLLASEAQQQDSKAQLYIEEKFSSKARNLISYLGEIVSVAEYEVHDIKNRHFETKDRLHALQQQLVCAYEEIEYTKESQLYH